MAGIAPREVTPIIARLRDFLNGRKLINMLRFENELSPRSGPPPNLPVGPSHKLSANDYYKRDGRRFCEKPRTGYDPHALPAGESSGTTTTAAVPTAFKVPKPGYGYDWETGGKQY